MSTNATYVPLVDALEERRFGGKAVQCGAAARAGLPVPAGFALPGEAHAYFTSAACHAALEHMLEALGGLVAVRSSAVGEDSAQASFAGQHATVLGVHSVDGMRDALREVYASASTASAAAYRAKLGLDAQSCMGIVVQRLIPADAAGVLFSRDPLSGADLRVIEAAWGLGEVVVQGLVTPDQFRVARGGEILERVAGDKDLMIRWTAAGGTEEVDVAPERVNELCLSDALLRSLDALTSRCEALFGGTQDLEFAVADGSVHLLQRRAITRV